MGYRSKRVPLGGLTGEVLTKTSNDDNDVEWSTAAGGSLPAGGADGDVLTKQSAADGDADWEAPSGGSGLSHPQVMTRAALGF
jgi:hypothetical protein